MDIHQPICSRLTSNKAYLHALLVFIVGYCVPWGLDDAGTAVPVISSSVMASCPDPVASAIVFGRVFRALAIRMVFARRWEAARMDHGTEVKARSNAQ